MYSTPISVNYKSEGSYAHRAEYDRVLIDELKGLNIHLERMPGAGHAADPGRPLFYSMLDAHVLSFLRDAVMRSVRGRSTVGLFFRPGECFLPATKYRIKQKIFQAVSRLPHVTILTLMPFSVCPRFQEVANGWIYDPQLWDLLPDVGPPGNAASTPLHDLIGAEAQGRRIVMAIGAQRRAKGFDYLADLWSCSAEVRERFLFVAAGKIYPESAPKADLFEQLGGHLIDRHLSDTELISIYGYADIVWSCYEPSYNQSSGIFGRAVQLGVPVIVRKDSYLEKLAGTLSHPTLAIAFEDADAAARQLLAWNPAMRVATERISLLNDMRAHSVAVLARSLAEPTSRPLN